MVIRKFLNVLKTENFTNLSGKPKKSAESIVERLNSNDEWDLILYQVSNESNETAIVDPHLQNLKDSYDLKIMPLGLTSISEMMSIRPKPIGASLILEKEAVMSFTTDSIESAKSYIARVHSNEIVRITAKSEETRNDYNIEDIDDLSNAELDYGVLFDNVRGFILKSKFNPNIISSLKNDPEKFFMYNNGITIVAESIEAKKINGDKRVKLTISNFKILNGGQTVRSIHKFNKENKENISKYLSESEVLVRIFMADSEGDEVNKIAEYTNSQNAIKSSDLKSLTKEQIDLEKYLDTYEIIYARKSGDTGKKDKDYNYKITMEKFGQILTAVNGNPERSTNSIQNIFGKHYDELFVDNFDLSLAPQLIKDYFNIIKIYKESNYPGVQIKYFYIMFISTLNVCIDFSEMVEELEDALTAYVAENQTSDVRKLGQVKFRQDLVERLEVKYKK